MSVGPPLAYNESVPVGDRGLRRLVPQFDLAAPPIEAQGLAREGSVGRATPE